MRRFIFIFIVLIGCENRPPKENNNTFADSTAKTVTPEDAFEKIDTTFNYAEFYGVYDHESTTKGFAAVLSLTQNGNNLYFTVSVSQGNCKKETEGVVMIIPSDEKFPAGFYQADNCRLQFIFMKAETKVDIKEITFCGLDGLACSYEGLYKKRSS